MTDRDYRDILRAVRQMLIAAQLGSVDERIMSSLRGSEEPFWELISYLKYLTEEVALGSDQQLSGVLRRVRANVQTSNGDHIEGIRVDVVEADRSRYGAEHIDFAPDPELGRIAEDLRGLIGELLGDHERGSSRPDRS